MDEYSVSIIIPVYNVEQYLEECLKSALEQTFCSYEIICVNDASTDKSEEILERYSLHYPKIHIISHDVNKGLSAARNSGIDVARGKYILFLDSDDKIIPNTLEELFLCAEKNILDEVYFNMQYLYEDNLEKVIKPERKNYMEYNDVCTGQEMFCRFQMDETYKIEAWRQFYRRDFLCSNNLRFYEGILHEDNLFSFLCAMKAQRVMNVNKDYYIYRKRQGSIMATVDKKRAESMYIVLIEIFKYWNLNNFSLEVNEAISDYFGRIYSMFSKYKNYCTDFNISMGTIAEKVLYKLLNENSQKQNMYVSTGKMEKLRNAEDVIVYGAGKVAIDVINFLYNYGIGISAVAVSNKNVNSERVCGIKIQEITELHAYKKSAIVIVAVSSKYQKEIVQVLNEQEFQNIMTIDEI